MTKGRRKEYIYVYGGVFNNQGIYKIGHSTNPVERVKSFPQMPWPCKLVTTVYSDDAPKLEKDLHTHWKNKHLNGEWFRLALSDVQGLLYTVGKLQTFSCLPDKPTNKLLEHIKGASDSHGELDAILTKWTRMTENTISEQAQKSQREDRILRIIGRHNAKKGTWPTLREIRKQTGPTRYRMSNEELFKVLDVLKDANLIEEFKTQSARAYRYKLI